MAGQPNRRLIGNCLLDPMLLVGGEFMKSPGRNSVVRLMNGSWAARTFLVGERDRQKHIGGIWPRRNSSYTSIIGDAGHPLNTPWAGSGTTSSSSNDPNWTRSAWTSMHTGGANFVFGDGSVRFIRDSIETDPAAPGTGGAGVGCPIPKTGDGHFTFRNLAIRVCFR